MPDQSASNEPRVTIRVSRTFAASPERVFDAWLDPARARLFLFATKKGEMVRAETDPRAGGRFTFVDRRDGVDVEHVGTYVEIDRPRRLVFDFAVPQYTPDYTRVTIEIAPRDGGCELTLVHDGVFESWAAKVQGGWTSMIDALDESLR